MKSPLISIIIPVYNAGHTLKDTVYSILGQSYPNFEVLLVDDGSQDDTGTICDNLVAIDTRIKVFHKENGGVSSARNIGIKNALGEWISFIDSDDWVDKEFLKSFIDSDITIIDDLIIGGICFDKDSSFIVWDNVSLSQLNGAKLLLNSKMRGVVWNKCRI